MSLEQNSANKNLKPSKSLLKRIDIGLTIGVCALCISLLSLLLARHQAGLMLQVQKARVLPIINIEMGYIKKPDANGDLKQHFDISLSNEGAGIAHIQSVAVLKNGELIENYKDFENSIMTPRMRSWSTLTETSAAGYLRAGDTSIPASYRLGAAESDLSAYLRGEWGKPLEGIDLDICYCSVFEDCWTVQFLNRKIPQPIEHCGIDDEVFDSFTDFLDQRANQRQNN